MKLTSNNMKNSLCLMLVFLFLVAGYSQETRIDSLVYKSKDSITLSIKVIYPPSSDNLQDYPAIVFFSGSNWDVGKMDHFARQADYFATRGIVCFLTEYGNKIRSKDIKESNLQTSISDAKSCIRFIRENTKRFNVADNQIIAAGGSAGGHLAAALASIEDFDDPNDNVSISAKPNALVLFNPVLDFGAKGDQEIYKILGKNYTLTSPAHNVKKGMPPTLILHGSEDIYNSPETILSYKASMEDAGNRCDVIIYDGQEHGFFNYGRSAQYYKETVLEMDRFLISLGYAKGAPMIMKDK